MASFSLDYSSSEEDQGNTAFPFQYWRSPQPPNPSPFNSDSSDFESQGSPGTSRPETPGTPLSPASSLGGAFSYIDLSSQTSDGATAKPKPLRGRKYTKKKSGTWKKGHQKPPRDSPLSDSPAFKMHKVERPKSPLFSEMRFSLPVTSYSIKAMTKYKYAGFTASNWQCDMQLGDLVTCI